MSERPSLVPALRVIELAAQRDGMPAEARIRIGRRIAQRASRSPTTFGWPGVALVAAAIVLIATAVGLVPREPSSTLRAYLGRGSVRPAVAGLQIEGRSCRAARGTAVTELRGSCRLHGERLVAQTEGDARVRGDDGVLRVERGRVTFDVEHVAPGDSPVRVLVSHGTIEVLGTRFTVEQDVDGGHVDLHEGAIRFVGVDGRDFRVRPGERHTWGGATRGTWIEPELEIELLDEGDPIPSSPRASLGLGMSSGGASSTRPPRRGASHLVDRVNALRSEGHPREAAAILRKALQHPWDARTAQVLSYELIDILDRDLGDHPTACRHLRAHQRRWPTGRYAEAIARALGDC